MRLTKSNVIGKAIEYIPTKTKGEKQNVIRVPLNERAFTLIEKYKGKDIKARLFPFISAQKYNNSIKEIFLLCGVTRMITTIDSITGKEVQRPINEVASSHMARRTFVGNTEEKNIIFLEEQYFKSQKAIYYRINKDDYEYYSANNLNDKIQELDTLFIKQHIKQECILLDRTKKGDDIGIIAAFLNYSKEYFKFLENKLNNKIGNRKVVTDSINIEYQKQIIKPTKNKEYQESLLKLFKGNVYLISHLEGLSDDEIASLIKKWAKEKDKSGKPLIENPENRLKNKYAEELKKAGIIKLSVRTFRDKL